MLEDRGDIVVGRIQELDQIVFHLNVVVGTRKAESCRRFERAAGRIVELTDQRLEIHFALPWLIRAPALYLRDRG